MSGVLAAPDYQMIGKQALQSLLLNCIHAFHSFSFDLRLVIFGRLFLQSRHAELAVLELFLYLRQRSDMSIRDCGGNSVPKNGHAKAGPGIVDLSSVLFLDPVLINLSFSGHTHAPLPRNLVHQFLGIKAPEFPPRCDPCISVPLMRPDIIRIL